MNIEVDLTNCDREPIHIPGSVQPFGFLLALLPDFTISIASESVKQHLGIAAGELLQCPVGDILLESAVKSIRERIDFLSGPDAVERMFGVPLMPDGPPFDLAVHFAGVYFVIEAEPSIVEPGVNSGELVRLMLARIRKTRTTTELAQEAARQLRVLTGFDRVMVYRFHFDGSGEVIAEAATSGLESFLGLHYPASDIPKQARLLYQRNWLRIIADINEKPAPLQSLPMHTNPLDLSMSVLRSVSPIHIEYLRNMGVGASMSVSILSEGKLWGLFACHHYSPRHISFERRTASELFGQMFSWILEGQIREEDVAYEGKAQQIQERLMEAAATHAHSKRAVLDFMPEYRKMIACDGIAVWSEGETTLDGETTAGKRGQGSRSIYQSHLAGTDIRHRRDRQSLRRRRVVSRPGRGLSRHSAVADAARLPALLSPGNPAVGELGGRSQQALSGGNTRASANTAQKFRALARSRARPVQTLDVSRSSYRGKPSGHAARGDPATRRSRSAGAP